MLKSKQKGFTLIELLVVIAIIGILSSIVLASLNSARDKAANTKIKSQLSSLRTAVQIYYDNRNPPGYIPGTMTPTNVNTGYACLPSMFNDPASGTLRIAGDPSAWPPNTTVSCQATSNAYAASASLPVGEGPGGTLDNWCVDSTGKSMGITDPLADGDVTCL